MSYIKIVLGGVENTFSENINLKNLKYSGSLKEGEKQDIFTMSGTILFYGTDFKRIVNDFLPYIPYRDVHLYNDLDILQGIGTISFQEGFDYDKCIADLKVISNDKYEKIYKNIGTEYNYLGKGLTKKQLGVTTERYTLEFSQYPFQENNNLGSIWYNLNAPIYVGYENPTVIPYTPTTDYCIYARQVYIANAIEIDLMVGKNGWELKNGTTNVLIRDWSYNFVSPVISDFYDDTIIKLIPYSSTIVDPIELQDIIEPINSQVYAPDGYFPNTIETGFSTYTNIGLQVDNNQTPKLGVAVYLQNSSYYPSNYHGFTDFYILGDVIEYLLSEIDPSILVYKTGISFFWWWDETPFKYMRIIDIASLLVQINGATYIPSFIVKLSLKSILDWLKNDFGADWYIDVNNVFIIKQFKNFTKDVSTLKNHDLTNINGFNVSENCSDIQYNNSKRYDRIVKKTTAGSIDFVGQDIVFPNISEVKPKTDINETFYVDISDIVNFPSRYNEQSQNQFCVVCVSNQGFWLYTPIKESVGAISGKSYPNADLSIGNLQENLYLSRMSDTLVEINGVERTIGPEYLEKFREIKQDFFVPCRDFLNDFNLTQFVKTDLSDSCEIISIDYLHEFDKVQMKLKY